MKGAPLLTPPNPSKPYPQTQEGGRHTDNHNVNLGLKSVAAAHTVSYRCLLTVESQSVTAAHTVSLLEASKLCWSVRARHEPRSCAGLYKPCTSSSPLEASYELVPARSLEAVLVCTYSYGTVQHVLQYSTVRHVVLQSDSQSTVTAILLNFREHRAVSVC